MSQLADIEDTPIRQVLAVSLAAGRKEHQRSDDAFDFFVFASSRPL
jgi:hypothetical protein